MVAVGIPHSYAFPPKHLLFVSVEDGPICYILLVGIRLPGNYKPPMMVTKCVSIKSSGQIMIN